MATSSDFIEYVHEQSGLGPTLTYRKMFGEYALYVEGKVVALACDNSLYVKPTQATHQLSVTLATKPPFPGAKPHLVADELLDDSEALRRILLATAAALPASKIKTKTKTKAKTKTRGKPSKRR